ncbi:HAD hydrolase-like protein [Methanobrevibacter sp. TMH8]|uniref:HAD hydrolase-like protein n=1 Tax=Methanobrevibacter sp. TMH8 TaxID=2848611 RepID=UPI001CCE4613|nr:HAD hydrolase-like protein [Methanobrevibacter sp. TMH8]MBZ9571339.1 HAD hydrolase-like protein [Methanobrevibacter sp. TMH8]
MLKKLFVTDCEGPLSLNDNAYELAKEFIPEGDEFFRIISLFDDYLVDIVKKADYNSGNTLKLIAPFFKAYGVTNEDIVKFSKENIFFIDDASDTIELAKKSMDSFIVSTSYGQYIEAVCNNLSFPFENTFYTLIDLDNFEISNEEIEKLYEFKDIISQIAEREKKEGSLDVDQLNKIFFEEIPKMNINKLTDSIICVGGIEKQKAIEEILSSFNLEKSGLMYVGDSHTDIEPLKFAKEHGGIAVSFNGNEAAVKESEIAIISENTIATSLLIDLHSKFNKDYVLEFVKSYSSDPKRAFESFRIGFALIDKFNEIFSDKDLPIIEIITEDNIDDIINESIEMRKKIRGLNIGSLG